MANVNYVVVLGDARTVTGQAASVAEARDNVQRMAADPWYVSAAPVLAVYVQTGEGQLAEAYSNVRLAELQALRPLCEWCGQAATGRARKGEAVYLLCGPCVRLPEAGAAEAAV